MNDSTFIPIFTPSDSIQAGLIHSVLEQADIICYVNNENFSAIRMGGLGMGAGGMSIMVPDNQAEQAIGIIK